jgi:hypothetical protein
MSDSALEAALAAVLRQEEPELYAGLAQLVALGETPEAILRELAPSLRGGKLLRPLIEVTLAHLARERQAGRMVEAAYRE